MRKEHMKVEDLYRRVETQERFMAKCLKMLEVKERGLEERVRELEERVDVLLSVG